MSQRDLSDYDKEESDTGLYGEPRGYSTPRLSDEEREALERRIILKAAKMLGVDPDELTKEEASGIIQADALEQERAAAHAGEDMRNRLLRESKL